MARIFYGWWVVLACFLSGFLVGGGLSFGFTAFFEPIVQEFRWSYTQVSIAFSLRGLEMGILAPIIGFLVDRFGSRKLAFSGVVIVGFSLILLSQTNSLVMFYGSFILLTLGRSGCTSTVLMTAVAQWFRRNVGKAMGIVACGFGAGGILIPLIVWLIDAHGWRTALMILGLGVWMLGIPFSLVIRHRPELYGLLPDGEIPTGAISGHGGERIEEATLKEALKNRNFWKIGVADAMRVMTSMAVITHVMPYLSSIGMSRSRAAFVATSIPLLSIVGRIGFGWLGDIFDKRYVLAMVYCLFGMGTLAFSYLHCKWPLFPFFFLLPPAWGGVVALRGALVREYFGAASFGRLLGIILGMAAMGGIIGPSAAGWAFDRWGSYHPVWLFFTGTIVIAMLLTLQLTPPTDK